MWLISTERDTAGEQEQGQGEEGNRARWDGGGGGDRRRKGSGGGSRGRVLQDGERDGRL
jgi:hypothetical protein